MKVPRGIVFKRGFKFMDRRYRVNVPGNENRRAAVAWWRKLCGRKKYAGRVAAYVRIARMVSVYRTFLLGGRGAGQYG
jgi:hypothetical protein